MTAIKKYPFPYRLPARRLALAYGSLEEAFAAHDYPYVARFAQNDPDLRGCALILLGNRVGGERLFEQNKIHTAQSCFYRSYAAWQDGDAHVARCWLAESRALDRTDVRLDKLAALIERPSFHIIVHSDPYEEARGHDFSNLLGFDVQLTHHLSKKGKNVLPFGKPLASILSQALPVDLVLIDGLKLPAIGLDGCGAPVVAHLYDNELLYELLDEMKGEIDFCSTNSTSERIELTGGLQCPVTVNFLSTYVQIPDYDTSLAEKYVNFPKRKIDLLYNSHIGNDFYRYKRQEILSLAKLDNQLNVKILSKRVPLDEYWGLMRSARFTMMSARTSNNVSTRAVEAIVSGTLHLVEKENAFPYIFSEQFHCFCTFDHSTILSDIEKHLHNCNQIFERFRPQIPQLEREMKSLMPVDNKKYLARYLRHLLFMTRVETDIYDRCRAKPKSQRKQVRTNIYDWATNFPNEFEQLIQQTVPPDWLRIALAKGLSVLVKGRSREISLAEIVSTANEGLKHFPDSAALYFIRGMCRRFLDEPEEAEKDFSKVTSGKLVVRSDDPGAFGFGRFNSFYWIADARIRAKCSKDFEPYISVEDVWISYAWANRADIVLHQGFAHAAAKRKTEAIETLLKASDFATKSMNLLMANDAAHRVYLRALYALSEFEPKYGEDFLEAFDAACYHDYTVLHDFAAAAIAFLLSIKRIVEADEIRTELKQFFKRVELQGDEYTLYPEIIPLLYRNNVPHKKLERMTG